jgi:hypothetical protein
MSTVLSPDGTVRTIPEDQVGAALSSGGKQVSKVISPQGDVHWIPSEALDQARAAGGTVVHDDGSFQVTPLPDESFSDTMRRAANAGKSVGPELLRSQGIKGLKEAPVVMAAAPLIGAAGAGALMNVGTLALGGAVPTAVRAGIEAIKAHPVASTALAVHFAREAGIPVPKSIDILGKFLGGKP